MSDSDEELSFASVDDADEEKISGTVIMLQMYMDCSPRFPVLVF